jgi:hypothetical protein
MASGPNAPLQSQIKKSPPSRNEIPTANDQLSERLGNNLLCACVYPFREEAFMGVRWGVLSEKTGKWLNARTVFFSSKAKAAESVAS